MSPISHESMGFPQGDVLVPPWYLMVIHVFHLLFCISTVCRRPRTWNRRKTAPQWRSGGVRHANISWEHLSPTPCASPVVLASLTNRVTWIKTGVATNGRKCSLNATRRRPRKHLRPQTIQHWLSSLRMPSTRPWRVCPPDWRSSNRKSMERNCRWDNFFISAGITVVNQETIMTPTDLLDAGTGVDLQATRTEAAVDIRQPHTATMKILLGVTPVTGATVFRNVVTPLPDTVPGPGPPVGPKVVSLVVKALHHNIVGHGAQVKPQASWTLQVPHRDTRLQLAANPESPEQSPGTAFPTHRQFGNPSWDRSQLEHRNRKRLCLRWMLFASSCPHPVSNQITPIRVIT